MKNITIIILSLIVILGMFYSLRKEKDYYDLLIEKEKIESEYIKCMDDNISLNRSLFNIYQIAFHDSLLGDTITWTDSIVIRYFQAGYWD